jgi:hypothetical protein
MRALLLVAIGIPGLVSLWPLVPAMPGVPRPVLLLQPALLLAAAALAGSWAAARCGFRLLADPRPAARLGEIGLGLAFGMAIALADHAARGLWQISSGLPPSLIESWRPEALPLGLLYGGVVEEVIFRWGVLSLATLAFWRATSRGDGAPPAWCLTAAAVVSAALFAASHLPALALAGVPPGLGALLRTLLLNTLAGLVFALLFVRRDLLAAMLAHATTHLGFAAVALLFRA